jgi:hypothetical protein
MDRTDQEAAEERLNSALTSIRVEFASAHEDLARQLEQANQRLGNLLGMFSTGTPPREPAAAGIDLEKLRHAIAERDLALAASNKHAAELEAAMAELKAEIAQLRSRESWVVAANQDLSERLVVLRAEEKTHAKILAKANEEAERFTKALADRDLAIEALNKQADLARKNIDEARQTSKRLAREAAAMRRGNARLQDALAAADANASVRGRQQRILLEALIANGHAGKLGEILISADIITRDQLAEALGEQESGGERMVGEILVNKGQVEEEDVAQAVACQLHLPIIQLCEHTVQEDAIGTVDDILCMSHKCIPIRMTPDRIFVAMANPRDEHAVRAIEIASKRRVVVIVATPSDVQAAIRHLFCI